MRNPFGADWRKKFTELKQETIEIRKEVHAIRIATTIPARNQTGPSEQVFSYVEALKRGTTAPAHFLSAHGSTSTQAASPSELSKDQLGDQEIAEKPTMLAAGATAGPDPVLAAIQFVAARQLKSGDLSVRLRSTRDVEAARIHRHEWIRHLWKGAEVRLPSYGVVIHDATVSEDIRRPIRPPPPTGIHQSIHEPTIFRASRSGLVKTRSKTAASSQASSALAPARWTLRATGKGQKLTAPEGNSENELSWNPPSSSSALVGRNSNGSGEKSCEISIRQGNQPIFAMPGRTTVAKRKRFETDNSVSELSCLIGITDSSEANTNERTANTNSNDDVVADLLRNPKVLEADIIAIPEPWDNPSIETTHHSAKQTHELVFPSTNETGGRARRRQDENGEQEEIRIVNVYNPVGCIDTIAKLEDILGRNAKASIIVGGFNLHHPACGGEDAV
ncbi:hypothetical protein N7522_003526 [Penicillium canescens]|nr:hypothetical protein N7522_003526 [Penicillium canescens]